MRLYRCGLGALLLLVSCKPEPPPPPPPPPTTTIPAPVVCEAVEKRGAAESLTPADLRRRVNQPRIVGGEESEPGAWPWAAAVGFYAGPGLFQYCGGALIAPEWVLTAAHCDVAVGDVVVIGRHDLTKEGGVEHRVDRVLTHAAFVPDTQDNDIALLHLSTPSLAEPIELETPEILDGDSLTVVGWGALVEGGDTSHTLQQVDVELVSREACAQVYAITDNMICAGYQEGGRDSCQGDSGGPLMAQLEDAWAHVGLVSFGFGCARPNAPGVYTKTANYTDWIEACTQ